MKNSKVGQRHSFRWGLFPPNSHLMQRFSSPADIQLHRLVLIGDRAVRGLGTQQQTHSTQLCPQLLQSLHHPFSKAAEALKRDPTLHPKHELKTLTSSLASICGAAHIHWIPFTYIRSLLVELNRTIGLVATLKTEGSSDEHTDRSQHRTKHTHWCLSAPNGGHQSFHAFKNTNKNKNNLHISLALNANQIY